MPIEATFEVTSWDEEPFDDGVGVSKLTRAVVAKEYAGDITGTSTTEWLMAYEPDKSATFVGLERIRGTVGGKRGSLVVQHVGQFADGAATATLTIVSGTDELRESPWWRRLPRRPGGHGGPRPGPVAAVSRPARSGGSGSR